MLEKVEQSANDLSKIFDELYHHKEEIKKWLETAQEVAVESDISIAGDPTELKIQQQLIEIIITQHPGEKLKLKLLLRHAKQLPNEVKLYNDINSLLSALGSIKKKLDGKLRLIRKYALLWSKISEADIQRIGLFVNSMAFSVKQMMFSGETNLTENMKKLEDIRKVLAEREIEWNSIWNNVLALKSQIAIEAFLKNPLVAVRAPNVEQTFRHLNCHQIPRLHQSLKAKLVFFIHLHNMANEQYEMKHRTTVVHLQELLAEIESNTAMKFEIESRQKSTIDSLKKEFSELHQQFDSSEVDRVQTKLNDVKNEWERLINLVHCRDLYFTKLVECLRINRQFCVEARNVTKLNLTGKPLTTRQQTKKGRLVENCDLLYETLLALEQDLITAGISAKLSLENKYGDRVFWTDHMLKLRSDLTIAQSDSLSLL